MALCRCGNTFPEARRELGYTVCLDCGDEEAQREKERKSRCTAPLYNKGPHQYIGTEEQAKWIGRK